MPKNISEHASSWLSTHAVQISPTGYQIFNAKNSIPSVKMQFFVSKNSCVRR